MADLAARFTEMVDLRIAHDVYMDRATRQFTESLHKPVRSWSRRAAAAVAERWPYSGGLTDEELEELVQPVKYGLISRTARMISESGQDFAGELHAAWTKYLKQLARHEYRFQRAATLEYAADPERAEAERWRESLGSIPELAPFGQFEKQMGKVGTPPPSLIDAAIGAPAPWDGRAWSDRLPYMESRFGGSGHDIVRARMTRAMRDGEPINVIRREVADSLSADYQHKVNIVTRTETARVQNLMKDSEYEAGAKQGLFSGKQASAIFDRKTCVECASYDGNRYYYDGRDPSVDDSPVYPVHPFCRCMYVPIPKWADQLDVGLGPRGTREFGPMVGDFENWMRRMNQRDSDFAREWMGDKKYRRWSQGASLEDIAGTSPGAQLAVSQFSGVAQDMEPPEVRGEAGLES